MRVRVDPARCQGNEVCTEVCPEVFVFDGEHAHVRDGMEEVTEERRDRVEQAVMSCPEGAILLEN